MFGLSDPFLGPFSGLGCWSHSDQIKSLGPSNTEHDEHDSPHVSHSLIDWRFHVYRIAAGHRSAAMPLSAKTIWINQQYSTPENNKVHCKFVNKNGAKCNREFATASKTHMREHLFDHESTKRHLNRLFNDFGKEICAVKLAVNPIKLLQIVIILIIIFA